ncbi:MAG TPA: outer membrane beta-barrel protein [Tenuifilaceae bacterium]|nr:outer membrane beta-barrel protein [Tenuifilaceae bacterium]HPE17068.1 outer membrane beta-barrel protein [Tenuifilaceae bacterium]HPJ44647.1 outer membrane beta-barrel protein [Tenuifilaceae bacterium]HPQ32910.1 outer membrane beta-barrel protein [Tenuifilaceae bacterium]HRX66728.1 outer membrane beta-barrel protein [Tenuifilaceae bacterium]
MKRFLTLSFALLFVLGLSAQDSPESMLKRLEDSDTIQVSEPDTISVQPVEQTVSKTIDIEIDENKVDTTRIRFGKQKVYIIEKDGSTAIEIPEKNDEDFDDDDDDRDYDFTYKRKPRFEGHWAGFEWGFNGFMDPNYSINMKDDLKYLELRQGRSWNINLNILQYSLGFGTDKVGLVTGLGFEFNDYHFRNNTNIKVENGVTMVDSSYFDQSVTKSKLSTSHLTIPLLLEFQIPTYHDKHRIFISTGVIGGVRLGTHTKVVYDDGDEKNKVKGDFNLAAFRYGLTARIGYRGLKLFANYYPTALFEKDKGPEVYPFSVGLILISFD